MHIDLRLKIKTDRDKNHGMRHWLDDEDKRKQDMRDRTEVRQEKAHLFFDRLYEHLKRDTDEMKRRYAWEIEVHRPQSQEILIEKGMPYPLFGITLLLNPMSDSLTIERRRKAGRDQQYSPNAEIWDLELDGYNELQVKAGQDSIEAEEASKRILLPLIRK